MNKKELTKKRTDRRRQAYGVRAWRGYGRGCARIAV